MTTRTFVASAALFAFASNAWALDRESYTTSTSSTTTRSSVELKPIGAVMYDDDGYVGLKPIGYVQLDGDSVSLKPIGYEADMIDDFEWSMDPADVSTSMADIADYAPSVELVGIIIRNIDGSVDLKPIGFEADDGSYVDLKPIGLDAATADSISLKPIGSDWSGELDLSEAEVDTDGYVDLKPIGSVAVEDDGSIVTTTTTRSR